MKRAEVLRLAEKCVCGGRDSDYGTPEDNFSTIAKLWTIYCGTMFTAKDVAMMMALLKIARIRSGHYSADSYVDLGGRRLVKKKTRNTQRRTKVQTDDRL